MDISISMLMRHCGGGETRSVRVRSIIMSQNARCMNGSRKLCRPIMSLRTSCFARLKIAVESPVRFPARQPPHARGFTSFGDLDFFRVHHDERRQPLSSAPHDARAARQCWSCKATVTHHEARCSSPTGLHLPASTAESFGSAR
jgi:hypothetical protein